MRKIPPFRLVSEPLSPEARSLPKFAWAPDYIGKRHRLGGTPHTHLQEDEWPVCARCSERMTFYGQLDSINDEFQLGDQGVVCVFVCFECREARALFQ